MDQLYGGPVGQAPPAVSAKRRSKRLTHAGYQLIDELYAIDQNPHLAKRKEVAKQIKALPGCYHYTVEKLSLVLYQRRKADAAKGQGQSASTSHSAKTATASVDILYPSFRAHPDTIPKLEVLVTENPSAAEEEIRIWAKRLNVDLEDVMTWLDMRTATAQKEKASSAELERPLPHYVHLPTPGSSCSPEPQGSPSRPEEKEEKYANALSSNVNHKLSFSAEQLQKLAQAVHNATSGQADFSAVSAEEAESLLERHAQEMSTFIERVESGAYTPWGLEPSFLIETVKGKSKEEDADIT